MTKDPVLVSISKDDAGYVVIDAVGTVHRATDPAALGQLLVEIIADETIPRFHVQKRNDLVGMVAAFARRFFPQHAEHIDAAEPLAHHVTEVAPTIVRRRRTNAARSRSG